MGFWIDPKLRFRLMFVTPILVYFCLAQNVLCSQYCDKLLAKYPQAAETVALIKAVSYSRDGKMGDAVRTLEEYAARYPAKQVYIRLAAVSNESNN